MWIYCVFAVEVGHGIGLVLYLLYQFRPCRLEFSQRFKFALLENPKTPTGQQLGMLVG